MVSRSVLKPDKGKNADFWLKQTWRLDIVHYIRIWSSRTGNVLHSSRESAFACLLFNKVEEVQHSIVIPSDSHSGINYPPFANANGFETTDCLECLQILDILIYGRRAWQQRLVATGYKSSIQEIHWISIKMVSRSVLKPDNGKNADFWLKQTWRLDIVHHDWLSYSRTGNVLHASLRTAFAFLSFTQRKKCHMLPLFPGSDIVESTFHQPQAGPPLSPERETFCMLSLIPT